MGDVVDLPVITSLDLDPRRVLAKALEAGLSEVVIIGHTKDGDEYFASSISDGGSVVWMLERTNLKLLRIGDAQ